MSGGLRQSGLIVIVINNLNRKDYKDMKIKDVIRIINAWKEDCETAEGRQQETSRTSEKKSINR